MYPHNLLFRLVIGATVLYVFLLVGHDALWVVDLLHDKLKSKVHLRTAASFLFFLNLTLCCFLSL